MTLIEFTAIDTKIEKRWIDAQNEAAEERRAATRVAEFDEDDLERPVGEDEEGEASEAVQLNYEEAPVGTLHPVVVVLEELREFYPRKGRKPGTRLVFKNGAARVVKETFGHVRAIMMATGAGITSSNQVNAEYPQARSGH